MTTKTTTTTKVVGDDDINDNKRRMTTMTLLNGTGKLIRGTYVLFTTTIVSDDNNDNKGKKWYMTMMTSSMIRGERMMTKMVMTKAMGKRHQQSHQGVKDKDDDCNKW